MVDYTSFSGIRLRHLFPRQALETSPWYSEVQPEGRGFDIEYLGGLWDHEKVEGATLWFPQTDGSKVGIVEVSGGPNVDAIAVEGKPAPDLGLNPAWVANANCVLTALRLPRLGASEAAVRALAAGRVLSSTIPDSMPAGTAQLPLQDRRQRGARTSLFFACRIPDVYHMNAVVHATAGLLKLEVRRPDVVRANDAEGTYDASSAGMYDAGPG